MSSLRHNKWIAEGNLRKYVLCNNDEQRLYRVGVSPKPRSVVQSQIILRNVVGFLKKEILMEFRIFISSF